jgi:serine/threonine protein kinase
MPVVLIRPLDSGGFGEVWLGRDASGELKAVKRIPVTASRALAREQEALEAYQRARHRLRCPSLLPIESVHRTEEELIYVMPLGDGTGAVDPEDPDWTPLTLAGITDRQRSSRAWFTGRQIRELLLPVVDAVMALSEAGLVHRDIKPANILVRNGATCLADFGLLHPDSPTLSAIGTPGFFAPSWYVETGGHPDMWGLACVLYTLLSGNAPDKLGRAAYRWPPQGESSLSPEARQDWLRLHRLLQRSTHEKPEERFLRLEDFRAALSSTANPEPPLPSPRRATRKFLLPAAAVGILGLLFVGRSLPQAQRPPGNPAEFPTPIPAEPTAAEQAPRTAPPVHDPASAAEFESAEKALYAAMRQIEESLVLRPDGRGLDPAHWPGIAELGQKISRREIPRSRMESEVARAMEPVDRLLRDVPAKTRLNPEDSERHRALIQSRNDLAAWVRFYFCSLIPPEPLRRSQTSF